MTRFAIVGAGSIGCYVGGVLAANSAAVDFFGRERLASTIRENGLRITDIDSADYALNGNEVSYHTQFEALEHADTIFICVKSGDTEAVCQQIVEFLKPTALVVSLQNGVQNASAIKAVLPNHQVVAGMVPYNVVNMGGGHFHRGTPGALVLEETHASVHLMAEMVAKHLDCNVSDNIDGVLWGKLLINTNNALNMLSDKPLKEQLFDVHYRKCWALCMKEGLSLLEEVGILPVKSGDLDPKLFAYVAGFPNWILLRIAKGMRKIDDKARSSMWEDMQAGRASEVDFINGQIVALAKSLGKTAPVNATIVKLVHQAFSAGRSPAIEGRALLMQLKKTNSTNG